MVPADTPLFAMEFPGALAPGHVLAIPYPGRGHINPMMNLCERLASKAPGIRITFVVTEEWFGFIGSHPRPQNFVLETIPNVIPSEHGRGTNWTAFFEAVSTKMEAPFEEVLDRLMSRPSLIIADTLLSWVVEVGRRWSIPVASFWPMAASMFSFFHHLHLLPENGHFPTDLSEKADEVVDYFPGISPTRLADLPKFRNDQMHIRCLEVSARARKAQFLLIASVYELEQRTFDALMPEFSSRVYAIGPAIPYSTLDDSSCRSAADSDLEYLRWLDRQPSNSVLYVSLGSYMSVSRDQMDEIAAGLHDSLVRIMWVARDESARIKKLFGDDSGRVMIVPWCDQLRVLSHPAVGGFWSHCGWNSVKEGVFAGVPFLTFPIAADQPLNSKLVVEDWKIGWRVRLDDTRQSIAGLVRRFMDLQDDESRGIRARAERLRHICRIAASKDGSAEANIDEFLKECFQR